MAWKRVCKSTSVDVDLIEFNNDQLLQGLIDSKWLTESEAEAIKARAARNERASTVLESAPATEELAEATADIRRGRKSEALIHLERFLGRDWIGRLQ